VISQNGKPAALQATNRWVVERTLGWLSKCRAILVRYEMKAANYLGLIKVACVLLWYRRQHCLCLLR
jgi:putative transposase